MSIKTSVRSILCSAAPILILAGAASAQNLLVNGSFEQFPLGGANTVIPGGAPWLPGWTVVGQGIDHDTTFQAADGVQMVSTRWVDPSSLYQELVTTAAQTYTVSFAATRERPEGVAGLASTRGVQVLWNASVVDTLFFAPNAAQTNSNMMWQNFQYTVTGTGGLDRLTFVDVDSGVQGYGVELDDCRLETSPTPGAASLLGISFLLSARRRRVD